MGKNVLPGHRARLEGWPTYSGKPPRHHYGIFPWTVLDSTSGVWQRRKHELNSMFDGAAGRDAGLLFQGEHATMNGGTSIFDPVLADIMYQWYAPHSGYVYDPFAGGLTRGAIAHMHDMQYTGIDLSKRQVSSNRKQADQLGIIATWLHGDGTQQHVQPGSQDMVLTCPPYHTLEKYSDDPNDLSAMGWDEHLAALERTATECYRALRDDRYLVWVTGDLRDARGYLRDLPANTLTALTNAGFHHVNTHVLITPVGTMHRMLRRWWTNTRTAGRRHQSVLVMVKGDRRMATLAVNEAFKEHHSDSVYEGSRPPGYYRA